MHVCAPVINAFNRCDPHKHWVLEKNASCCRFVHFFLDDARKQHYIIYRKGERDGTAERTVDSDGEAIRNL